jgi:hypothetical protein
MPFVVAALIAHAFASPIRSYAHGQRHDLFHAMRVPA